jgi:hypothetical protein
VGSREPLARARRLEGAAGQDAGQEAGSRKPPTRARLEDAVGQDVSTDTLVAAAVRQRGIDVLLNAVAFSQNTRLLGMHASGAASSHAPFSNPKRLLLLASRPALHPRNLAHLPFPVDDLWGGAVEPGKGIEGRRRQATR